MLTVILPPVAIGPQSTIFIVALIYLLSGSFGALYRLTASTVGGQEFEWRGKSAWCP